MITFRIHGHTNEEIKPIMKSISRACFLSGYHTIDYSQQDGITSTGVVKADDKKVLSLDSSNPDFLILIETEDLSQNIKDVKDGTIILVDSKEKIKIPSLKKHKTKNFIVNSEEYTVDGKNKFASIVLGSVTKIFDKISIKNMKKAIELEIKSMDGFDDGYKGVKHLR